MNLLESWKVSVIAVLSAIHSIKWACFVLTRNTGALPNLGWSLVFARDRCVLAAAREMEALGFSSL